MSGSGSASATGLANIDLRRLNWITFFNRMSPVHTTFVVFKNKYVLLNYAFPRKRKMKARSGRRGGMQLLWLTQLREITMYVQRSVLSVQMFVYLVS